MRLALFWLAAFSLLGCGDPREAGDTCFDSDECRAEALCVTTVEGRQCLNTCSSGDTKCPGGEACVQSDENAALWVCLAGGETEVGETCENSVECELGAVCSDDGAGPVCTEAE